MASNESVAADLRKLQDWLREPRCDRDCLADDYIQRADEVETLIARLEAPTESLDQLQKRWIDWCHANLPQKPGGYPDWPEIPLAAPDPALEELRKLSDASDDPEEMLEVCAEIADLMDSDHTKAVSRLRELFGAARVEALREATSKIDKLPFMDSQGGGPLIYRSKVRATLAKLEEK